MCGVGFVGVYDCWCYEIVLWCCCLYDEVGVEQLVDEWFEDDCGGEEGFVLVVDVG